MSKLTTIAFDADDTLWHNERFFKLTQDRFETLLAPYHEGADLHEQLIAAERRNIGHYGFGIKGFVLSMIETALDVTNQAVPGAVIAELIAAGREMLEHPIELLPGAQDVLGALKPHYQLLVITKGDLLDQERKISQSGLGGLFEATHIVSIKDAATYRRIFTPLEGGCAAAMMVGNSLKSDVRPPIACGAWGVHVPHDLAWDLEHAEVPTEAPRFRTIPDLSHLPDLLRSL